MNTGYTVGEICTRQPMCIGPDEKVSICAKMLAEREVGSALICKKDTILGILTEQDIVRKVVAKGLDPKVLAVKNVMAKRVITITPDKDIYEAMVVMGREGIKHLPVVDDGKLFGIITFKDIIGVEPGLIEVLAFKHSTQKEEDDS